MSSPCSRPKQSAYETGRLALDDDRVFRPGGQDLTARAIDLADLRAGATVLDLGCGSGASVRYMRSVGIRATGIDCQASVDMRSVRDIPPHAYVIASAENLPFPDSSVDGVLAECSFSLMRNQDRVMAECARVLRVGGRLVLTDLYARQPDAIAATRTLAHSCVSGMIVRDQFEASLTRHGFSVMVWEDHSPALRECAARFIFEHDTLEGLWPCGGQESADEMQAAMRAARAGYFLLVATRDAARKVNAL